jgi:hypothetical protein|tara:strand:+ start:26460 stop:26585 length:126 start_codon:yes stop_codon:yes gene_type:complete
MGGAQEVGRKAMDGSFLDLDGGPGEEPMLPVKEAQWAVRKL